LLNVITEKIVETITCEMVRGPTVRKLFPKFLDDLVNRKGQTQSQPPLDINNRLIYQYYLSTLKRTPVFRV
jgi:hypothetical protein